MRVSDQLAGIVIVAWVAAVATSMPGVHAQPAVSEPRIWQGVYTDAQATRGKNLFNTACIRCHGADLAGTTAPALKGDRFQTSWGGDVIDRLFGKIRDTMPPNFSTASLDDKQKLDIVSYILQTNGYPAGTTELAVGSPDLTSAPILAKGQQATVQNFSLVQTVGCLTRGANDTWSLTRTTEPTATRDDASTSASLAAATSQPLGSRTFRLLSAGLFKPEPQSGQKVEARGLIYSEPGNDRLTLTSLTSTGASCTE
jgi:S-disulfanyl-L-cysteine oxidoreductase SoxD